MITGDHPLTAQSIAHQVGLEDGGRLMTGAEIDALSDAALKLATAQVSVFARTTPEHKLRIVKALRELGERVAATGDGTNDAPALVAADIGVAMGETGTDVARAAADIVLADDNFTTIVHAVEEGRKVFANLKKALRYYLACKMALVSSTLLPVLLRVPVPFAPIQIILTELFMDLAASSTFVAECPESDLMRQPPRDPKAPFMDRAMLVGIVASSAGLFAAVSVTYLLTWYSTADLVRSQTMAFVTWLLGHVFLAFNMRGESEPLARLGLLSNRFMILWGGAAFAFALAVVLFPPAQSIFKTSSLSIAEWLGAAAAALAGTFWMEVRKLIRWRELHRA
jgi:Ca2+-transporting ATPase